MTAKNREEVARALQEETGYALIHPFDDPLVIAGQGTAGLELLAQAGRMGVFPGAVLAPVGAGAPRGPGHGGEGPLPHNPRPRGGA